MKKFFTLFCLLFIVAATQAQFRYLKGILQGSQEVPANASTGSGVVIIKFNTTTRLLELWGNYKDLTAAINASHIHSPGAPGVNAPVLINLTNSGGTTGTLAGNATLTPAQQTDLLNGLMYVNVHNATYPNGEIRAQLTPTTDGQTDFINGRLQGAQQVPPNGSQGLGYVNTLVDKNTDSVWLTGNFSGLTAAASAAHIHNAGAPGVNGPVFLNLNFSTAVTGTLHVAAPITDANQTQMLNGTTYVNIHNAPYPGGEIRAQLTKLSQMLFFKGIMQGSQEVPPTSSVGTGTVIVKYNSETRLLELVGDYQNVSAAITASHIHSPGAIGTNAPVLINLTNTGGTSGTLTGSATLTPAQEADLINGLMYVNVHNATFPGGEIRAQLSINPGTSEYFTAILQGAQEVPPNGSTGSGSVTVLLDRTFSRVYLTGNFAGLTMPANAGHIHTGSTGVNGPVTVPLSVTNAIAGTITGNATVTAAFVDSLMRGFTYVNIHNVTFPGGEIRGQLGDISLPLKLVYFNGYKKGNTVALVWETAQEINLSHFVIEQQGANGNWISKRTVAAMGAQSNTKYSADDNPLPSKTPYVLYRLKIVDADGRTAYSPLVRINYSGMGMGLAIGANPVINNTLTFTISGLPTNQTATASVVDYNGRVVLRSQVSTLQNNRLSIDKLPAGMYRLIVHISGNTLQESFVK